MMHSVITATSKQSSQFRPLPQLQVKQQPLDWATECQTPLAANDDKDDHGNPATLVASSADVAHSPSPASEDSPDHPSTPPSVARGRPAPASQKAPFSSATTAATGGPFAWRGLADDLIKMHISDPNHKKMDDEALAHPLEASPHVSALRDGRYPMHTHLSFQPPTTAAAAAAAAAVVHSRASSGDTSSSENSSAQLQINTAVGSALASKPFTAAADARPRSFQDALTISDADRKRLQSLTPVKVQGLDAGQGPRTSPPRETRGFQPPDAGIPGTQLPRYPSLQDQPQQQQQQQQPTYPSIQQQQALFQQQQQQVHRPPPINVAPGGMDYRMNRPDDEYMQPRVPGSAQFTPQGRVVSDGATYRPPAPRGNQYAHMQMGGPASILAPPGAGYPYASAHMPLGPPTPQMYDLSLPASPFRGAHQHSASDSAVGMRDQAALALMPAHLPPMHPFNVNVGGSPMPPAGMLYPHQFFGGGGGQVSVQEAYGMGRMPQPGQYTPNGAPTPSAASYGSAPGSAGSQNGGNGQSASGGPSANNRKLGLYKTELCRSWEEKGSCRYGPKCQFAHGEDEIRKVARHPKYKTEICRTFWVSGSCPYGKRCCFIHTELPTTGGAPTASGTPPADTPTSNSSSSAAAVGRERSLSTNSDPNDAPVSLLTRIANQRTADAQAAASSAAAAVAATTSVTSASVSTPTEGSSTPTYQFPQQRPNSLRVDTSTIDTQLSRKQNKSAYPYMNNHSLPKNGEHTKLISPGPVTAGPDLGRSSSRFDAYTERFNKQSQVQTPTTGQQTPTNTQSSNTLRHSFNGTENLNLQTQLALSSGHSSPFGASQVAEGTGVGAPSAGTNAARASPTPVTHSRSESGSNWGAATGFTRGLGVSPNAASPWSGDLSVGSNRLSTNNNGERKWS